MWLFVLRTLGYGMCVAELAIIAICLAALCRAPQRWGSFPVGFVPIFALFHLLPIALFRLDMRTNNQVHNSGDSWRVGKYSEAHVRELARQCAAILPARLRDPRIAIADYRGTGGWTWLSLLCPGHWGRRTVWISAGALYYLEPDELQSVLAHEIGHHDPENRCDAPGGWMMADLALFSLMFWLTSPAGPADMGPIWPFFVLLRTVIVWIVRGLQGRSEQMIEHLCDLYAAKYVGREATVNMLLKLGEEEELTEVVVARAAHELLYVKGIELEDLERAFRDVRPYGRIFHDNLFQHAAQVLANVAGDAELEARESKRNAKSNTELKELLAQRRKARLRRIRWRTFDGDGDGRLTAQEIDALCEVLRTCPERALFLCESERAPTSHPSFRSRILVLCGEC